MAIREPSFTVGIEEEYLLIDPESRDLASDPPAGVVAACQLLEPDQIVMPEFLRAQIEVGTRVCANIKEAHRSLASLRGSVAKVAREHGLALVAASTHPFADWHLQKTTPKERYETLARDLQSVVRRLLICGMHVHVAIEDEDLRIDLMNQVSYFLPHFLALSTSSPFWGGQLSGLKSYRLTVFDALPRTGVPDFFSSYGEYDRLVHQMVKAELIEDATKLWWDVRPSHRFPTLEMRVTDVCTRLEDAVSIAALYVCALRFLYRLRRGNQRWRMYPSILIQENRWLAQRFGVAGKLVDFGRGAQVPFADLLDELLDFLAEDAQALDCVAEVEHARTIARRGTSADRQLEVYHDARGAGASEQEALVAVVDMLVADSDPGLARPA